MVFGIDFLSILAPSWLPTWGHLGGKDGSKFEKREPQVRGGASQERFLIRLCFWTSSKSVLASILGGSGLDFLRFLDDFSSFLAYFGHVFGCSCWGGYAPPDPPALDLVSVVLGQVFSQLCQENPRTCRGQSRESKNLPRTKPRRKSVRTPSGKLKSPSFLLPNSLPYRKGPDSENFGRRIEAPLGGSTTAAAQRFCSKEVCDKERSLEEQSFET